MNHEPSPQHPLLFSIDLEEFYLADPALDPGSSPLPELVERYLQLLKEHRGHGTFFVVGEVARRFPSLLRRIVAEGHELGCHGDFHRTIDQFTPESFAVDLRANLLAVEAAGGCKVEGFRAPLLSLTAENSWAHEVLASEGFLYSSSVLPAANPLYGWPEFGSAPRKVNGVLEIPLSTGSVPGMGELPLYSGTYFRLLPWMVTRRLPIRLAQHLPIACYFHPYDIDDRQPVVMHEGVRGNKIMNLLLFLRRRSLLRRLGGLLKSCQPSIRYRDFVHRTSPSI